jgi:type IX secretion system PorP/SprF family membrane protein
MKRYILLLACAFGFISGLSAQQIPMVNQYFYTPFIYNPAFSGASGATNAFLVHRSQWAGIPDAPITNAFNLEGSLANRKAGFGLSLYQDRSGILNEVGGYGSYSYRLNIDEYHSILLGAGLGVVSTRVDFDKIIIKDPNDNFLLQQAQSNSAFDANFGVAYNWTKLNVGVSIQQLMGSKRSYEDNNDVSLYLRLTRHMLATARYDFDLGESEVVLSPMFLLRYAPGAPVQYEGTVFATYKDYFGVGISYKSDYAVSMNAMVKPHEKLTIGYSYDMLINDLRAYAQTSHEFTLGYTFGSKKENKRLRILELRVDTLAMNSAANESKIANQEVRIGMDKIEIEGIKGNLKDSKFNNNTLTNEVQMLQREVDSLKRDQVNNTLPPAPMMTPQNNDVISPTVVKETIRTGVADDYMGVNGNVLLPGNYVVVGVFANESNANKFRTKLNSSIVILNKTSRLHYVYTFYNKELEPILPKLRSARSSITDEAWVLKLM